MKKLFFAALVAIVAVGGAFASASSIRTETVYGTLNTTGSCPSPSTAISCNPELTSNPICSNVDSQPLYTTNALTGFCTQALFID